MPRIFSFVSSTAMILGDSAQGLVPKSQLITLAPIQTDVLAVVLYCPELKPAALS